MAMMSEDIEKNFNTMLCILDTEEKQTQEKWV